MRKLFASLLASFALLTVTAHALTLFSHAPIAPLVHLGLLIFAVMSGVTALYLFRSPASWRARMVCPTCHQRGFLVPYTVGQPHPSLLAFIFGGIIFTILLQQSKRRRFHCSGCSTETRIRPVSSWFAIAWCLGILLYAVAWMVAQ